MTSHKAYIFPDPIDPEEFRCIQVYVPNSTLYLAAFWHAYEYFASPRAWANDPGHSALEVAAVWREAFDLARASYDEGDDCDMSYELRDDPDDPCKVQQSQDGGDTWTHAFNKEDCGGSLMDLPPFPDAAVGAREAAAAAIENIYQGLINLNPECSMSRADYIAAATAYMRTFQADYANPGALGQVYDAYCALDDPGKAEAQGQCKYAEHYEDIVPCYDAGGLMNDLNCLSDALGAWLDATDDALMNALNAAAAALSGKGWQSASNGGGGGAGGFGSGGAYASECSDWTHEMDFTSDPHDADGNSTIAVAYGEYVSGVGYKSDDAGGLLDFTIWIGGGYSAVVLTKIEIEFDGGGAVHHGAEKCRVMAGDGVWLGGPESPWGDVCGSMHSIHNATLLSVGHPEDHAAFIQIQMSGYTGDIILTGTVSTVSRIKFWGKGTNQFV